MKRRATTATAATALLVLATGCGDDYTEAQQKCVDMLEARYGEDGLVDVDDLTENSSGVKTKVEGSLVYREQQGAGDRVDTWFTCQLDDTGAVTLLEVK